MENLFEVLRMKEQEILRVKKEIKALRNYSRIARRSTPSAGDGTIELRKIVNMP